MSHLTHIHGWIYKRINEDNYIIDEGPPLLALGKKPKGEDLVEPPERIKFECEKELKTLIKIAGLEEALEDLLHDTLCEGYRLGYDRSFEDTTPDDNF